MSFWTWLLAAERSASSVEQTGGYCWSFYFHATPMLSLCLILHALWLATTAYGQHHFRHFGVDQQYPGVNLTRRRSKTWFLRMWMIWVN
jgi:hypothetical protein